MGGGKMRGHMAGGKMGYGGKMDYGGKMGSGSSSKGGYVMGSKAEPPLMKMQMRLAMGKGGGKGAPMF